MKEDALADKEELQMWRRKNALLIGKANDGRQVRVAFLSPPTPVQLRSLLTPNPIVAGVPLASVYGTD